MILKTDSPENIGKKRRNLQFKEKVSPVMKMTTAETPEVQLYDHL